MRTYESVFIARQDISAQQAEGLADTFAGIITEAGGTIARREYWGLRKLAYRIKKNRKGHYVLFNLEAPSDAVAEMERQMQLNEDVLRYLTLRTDEHEEGPSVIMQNRDRDDRPRRGGDRDFRGRGDRDRGRGGDRERNERPAEDKAPAAEAASTEGEA